MRQGHGYDSWWTEKVDTAISAITRNIDRSVWRDLMLKSGMISLIDVIKRGKNRPLPTPDFSNNTLWSFVTPWA